MDGESRRPCLTEVPPDDPQFLSDLSRFHYPFPRTVEDLAGSTVLRIHTEVTVGYIWFEPMSPEVADFHILISPDHHRRWLSRRILLETMSRIVRKGYRTIILDPMWASHARYVERLGFDRVGPFYLWRPREFQEAQDQNPASAPAARAGACR